MLTNQVVLPPALRSSIRTFPYTRTRPPRMKRVDLLELVGLISYIVTYVFTKQIYLCIVMDKTGIII